MPDRYSEARADFAALYPESPLTPVPGKPYAIVQPFEQEEQESGCEEEFGINFGDEHFTSFYTPPHFVSLEDALACVEAVFLHGREAATLPTFDERPFERITHARIHFESDLDYDVMVLRKVEESP